MFVRVTVFTALGVDCCTVPKFTGEGTAARVTTTAVPDPDRDTDPPALPDTFSVAIRDPVEVGVKVKIIVHDAPVFRLWPFTQVPVPRFAKSPGFVPVIVK